jgi:phage terminase Nu1 subunit (DNA packaging protein)
VTTSTKVKGPFLAEFLNLTARRVQQLAEEGVFLKAERGVYDFEACVRAYVRYLQQTLGAKSNEEDDGNVTSAKEQRRKILDVQLERDLLALAKDRGEVMAIDDHAKVLGKLIVEVRAGVRAIGARVKGRIVGQQDTATIQREIDHEVALVLEALARSTPMMPVEDAPAPPPKPARQRKPKEPPKE